MIRPPRLREGARIALVAPAGPVAPERVAIALDRCRRFGFEPVPGPSARERFGGYLAGTDEQRLADLQHALNAPDIDAVWALRGGYGTMRLLRHLDLAAVERAPRILIGFSDNTALHLALQARGVVSFHGPHAAGDLSPLSERCLRQVVSDVAAAGSLEAPAGSAPVTLRAGTVEAPLLGGNLALLAALCGTPVMPRAAGRILFLEDIGEQHYRLDRAWTQLRLAGVLDDVAGLAFGHFTDCGEKDRLLDLLYRLAEPLGVPLLAGLPIGHEPDNWTLPLGIRARLDAAAGTLALLEPAVC